MKIKISYNGSYPNLCSGCLVVYVDKVEWVFPSYCLQSGGGVSFTKEWDEIIDTGPWSVSEWPENFPEELKDLVIERINEEIPRGCCGGCV